MTFQALKDVFKAFAVKHADDGFAAKGLRIAAAGGKAALDSAVVEFPKDVLSTLIADFYAHLSSPATAAAVSATVHQLDPDKVQAGIDRFVARLQDPVESRLIVRQVQFILRVADSVGLLDAAPRIVNAAGLSPDQKLLAQALVAQIRPVLDEMKTAPDADVAAKLGEIAGLLPTAMIAMQVAGFSFLATPQAVAKVARALTGKLPSPDAVADILHGIAGEGSKSLSQITRIADAKEAGAIWQQFLANAQDVAGAVVTRDKAAKKNRNRGLDAA